VPQALKCLEHVFEVCRSSQINYLIPIISTSLGYAYALAGRTAEGIALLTKAEAYSKGAKFTYGEAWSSVYLGFAKLLSRGNEDLHERAQNVLELARKHKYRAIEVDALRLLGEIHKNIGASADAEAMRCYTQASEMCLDIGLQPEYVRCQLGLGQILQRSNRHAEAAHVFETAIQHCRSLDLLLPDIDLERIVNINSA
jgi:tetratricopeptide (TPR) repeat protein